MPNKMSSLIVVRFSVALWCHSAFTKDAKWNVDLLVFTCGILEMLELLGEIGESNHLDIVMWESLILFCHNGHLFLKMTSLWLGYLMPLFRNLAIQHPTWDVLWDRHFESFLCFSILYLNISFEILSVCGILLAYILGHIGAYCFWCPSIFFIVSGRCFLFLHSGNLSHNPSSGILMLESFFLSLWHPTSRHLEWFEH